MKKLLSLVFAFAACFSFWSCDDKDDHEIDRTPLPTTFELTVKDEAGNPVPGATVKLYVSEQDWNDRMNQVGATLTSDASGKVLFSDLTSANYYFRAEMGCLNNVNGVHVTASPLVLQTNNLMDIIVGETGTLSVTVNRVGVYSVFIDGVNVFDINGGETKYKYNIYAGLHLVHIVEIGGSYDMSSEFLIDCGQTTPVPFN